MTRRADTPLEKVQMLARKYLGNDLRPFYLQVLFVLSGIFYTIGVQVMSYNGISSPITLIGSLPGYLGMFLVKFYGQWAEAQRRGGHAAAAAAPGDQAASPAPSAVPTKILVFLVVLDVLANALGVMGLMLCGSGIFQVVHSSVVVFAAIFGKIFLGRQVTGGQWAAIVTISLGLAMSADLDGSGGDAVATGLFLSVISTVCYGVVYTATDYALTRLENPPSSEELAGAIGGGSSAVVLVYMAVITVPNWDGFVGTAVRAQGGSYFISFLAFCLVVLASFGLSLAYFNVLQCYGAVQAGVLQGLRSVGVFFLSWAMFCRYQEAQCMTVMKFLATLVVVTGVVVFSIYAPSKEAPEVVELGAIEKVVASVNKTQRHNKMPRNKGKDLVFAPSSVVVETGEDLT
eukprot:TRINITY_DN8200_c0_g1_i3.p1 TRINITY_DN8200_c0_g1~~TRINITY_DN8200_c0_g1_i3.p1  ORF type:complete len:402 (+),score=76.77 TRINITY_DN8200_c0_g1_i3:260-1465(+)